MQTHGHTHEDTFRACIQTDTCDTDAYVEDVHIETHICVTYTYV